MSQIQWRVYDREAETKITIRDRPHWDQTALTFVTFRLADSMPKRVVEHWLTEQKDWLIQQGFTELTIGDCLTCGDVPEYLRRQFLKFRKERWHSSLDDCHGSCVLKDPRLANEVSSALLFFNGERYDLERFVVMPNHVHVLVQMHHGFDLRKQCKSWLRFSARRINGLISRTGELWQSEPFDHIVRSENQFEYLQQYIADNPKKLTLPKASSCFGSVRNSCSVLRTEGSKHGSPERVQPIQCCVDRKTWAKPLGALMAAGSVRFVRWKAEQQLSPARDRSAGVWSERNRSNVALTAKRGQKPLEALMAAGKFSLRSSAWKAEQQLSPARDRSAGVWSERNRSNVALTAKRGQKPLEALMAAGKFSLRSLGLESRATVVSGPRDRSTGARASAIDPMLR